MKIKTENVNHPSHYNQNGVETIDVIKAMLGYEGTQSWLVGTIIKYLSRYQYKNGLEDLQKAKWYLDYLINMYKGKDSDISGNDIRTE